MATPNDNYNACLKLSDRSVIHVSGQDRFTFLQSLLTQDLNLVGEGTFTWSCLLDAKSKLIALVGVEKNSIDILLYVHTSRTSDVINTLEMYTVIQDVTLSLSKQDVFMVMNCETERVALSRLPIGELKPKALLSPLRLACGFPYPDIDYESGIPLEVGFFHQAISMTKGCYVGQETIARLYARGMNVSQKLLHIKSDQPMSKGDKVNAQGLVVGQVSSAAQFNDHYFGLAWVKRKGFDQALQINDKGVTVLPYAIEHVELDQA